MEAAEARAHGFSAPKRELLLLLKQRGSVSLADVSSSLGISKVAALRHLAALESARLVERSHRGKGVGRPEAVFRLSDGSRALFPQAYTDMSLSALTFIEERLGGTAVTELLQQRAREVLAANRARVARGDLTTRVAELAQVRDEGGYMAEVGARRKRSVELLEHNCPIVAIAGKYPQACEVERRLFESLLTARVEVAHRVVAGDPVCRFLVRPKEATP
jgi:predicted ArsR family transcriptional regulator